MPCLLEKYRELLPLTSCTPLITLGEGDTPLVRSQRLERKFNLGEVYFKLEGCNPTGSFKDRGMVVAVAKALERAVRPSSVLRRAIPAPQRPPMELAVG